MRLLIASEAHFTQDPLGRVYAAGPEDYVFWKSYSEVFDGVGVLARLRRIASPPPGSLRADGEGLITTRHEALATALRAARNYGDSGDYDCATVGLNARMTEFQAVLGRQSLAPVDRHLARKRLAAIYEQVLAGQPGLSLQKIRPQDRATRKDFSIVIDERRFGITRSILQSALEKENVEVRRYFDPPLHRQRLYSRFYRPELDPLENTEFLSRGVLSLPVYPQMSEGAVERIARRILEIRDWIAG